MARISNIFDSIFTGSIILNDIHFQEHKIADAFKRNKEIFPKRFNREFKCNYDVQNKHIK